MVPLFLGRDCASWKFGQFDSDIDDNCKGLQFCVIWCNDIYWLSSWGKLLEWALTFWPLTFLTAGRQWWWSGCRKVIRGLRSVSCEWAASCQLSQESHTAENYASVLKVAVTISWWTPEQRGPRLMIQVLFPFALNLFLRLLHCICVGSLVGSMRRWSANIEYPFSSLIQTNLDSKRF